MSDTLRDSAAGQILRLLSLRGGLAYPEETLGWRLPTSSTSLPPSDGRLDYGGLSAFELCVSDQRSKKGRQSGRGNEANQESRTCSTGRERLTSIPATQVQHAATVVTWYGNSDPANPQNWSTEKKALMVGVVCLYTFSVYMGISIYVASIDDVMETYGVEQTVASLGLSLYLLACGIGPLLFSPLSEIPRIGRSNVYVVTFVIFVILSLLTALVDDLAGFLILRFLLGFFGSPALATVGASLSDVYSPSRVPYVIALWAGAATYGPAIGPAMSGFAVQAKGWRWSSWILLWISAPVLVLLLFFPETSPDAILLQRAKRWRRITGRSDFLSQSELNNRSMTARQVAIDAFIKPVEINALDPAILFTTLYTALAYGISYSFFESFPLVYTELYGLSLGQTGLTFLVIAVSVSLVVPLYCIWVYFVAGPALRSTSTARSPEDLLLPGTIASGPLALGLFLFAWTSRHDISLFVSLLGVFINQFSFFVVMQSMLLYVALSYSKYAASLFAANDVARSSFAAGAVLFSRPMFLVLGIDWGVTLLASLAVACIAGIISLRVFGAKLRARSKFAIKPSVH